MKKYIIVIVLALTIGAGVIIFALSKQSADSNSTDQTTNSQAETFPEGERHEVHMTASGFTPSELTIKQGDIVVFINDDTENGHWPASNVHPSHKIYPEFDPKHEVAPGESWEFQFTRVGTWGMHDHLRPSNTGTITVTE